MKQFSRIPLRMAFWGLTLFPAALWAQTNLPCIEVTTQRESGVWSFKIDADAADQASVWLDLNNNGAKDDGENGRDFGFYYSAQQQSKTIKIYGKLTKFECYSNQVTSLNVANCPSLKQLTCTYNPITELNVTKNKQLTDLLCYGNQLKSIDLSQNASLVTVDLNGNQLTSLNLSGCPLLERLDCFGNEIQGKNAHDLITSLPNRSGKDKAGKLVFVNTTQSNKEKNVALISDVQLAQNKNWRVLDFFGQKNYDGVEAENYTTTQPAITLTTQRTEGEWNLKIQANDEEAKKRIWIDLNNNKHYDFGEEITTFDQETLLPTDSKTIVLYGKVTGLHCSKNQLSALEVDKNPHLQQLNCSDNQIARLNIEPNTELKWLLCFKNQLKELKTSTNTKLETLSCNNNQISSLDVTQNTLLSTLYASDNLLTQFDVSNNKELKSLAFAGNQISAVVGLNHLSNLNTLYCAKNKLSALDLAQCSALMLVSCEENALTSLTISQENKNLTDLYAYGNRIKKEVWAQLITLLPDLNGKNSGSLFMVDSKNPNEQNVANAIDINRAKEKNWNVYDYKGKENNGQNAYTSIGQIAEQDKTLSLYPNPAKTHITLTLPNEVCGQEIFITDLSGCVLMQFTAQTTTQTMDISSLPAGNYLLKTDRQAIRFTVVK